jgi:hypothetical protein
MSEAELGVQPQGQLEQEFWLFHAEYPHIYVMLCGYVEELLNQGYTKFAIACVWEHMRWELTVKSGDRDFVLPNNHRAYYARLWLRDNPEHPKFFNTAMLRSVRDEPIDRFGRELEEDCP